MAEGGFGSEASRLQRLCSDAVAAPSAAAAQAKTFVFTTPSPSSLEAWELALEAWVDCKPEGYVLDERRAVQQLPAIAERLPKRHGGRGAGGRALSAWGGVPEHDPAQLFVSTCRGEPPVFVTLLRPQDGKVHFLYFWKAFGEAAHMAGACFDEGLTAELEILRDRVLRRLEEEALSPPSGSSRSSSSSSSCSSSGKAPRMGSCEPRALPTWALVEEVHRAAAMSAYPRFWQRASESLAGQLELKELSLEELTSVLLSWLHDSQLWEQQQRTEAQELMRRSTSIASEAFQAFASLGQGPAAANCLPVHLHIYDVSQEEGIQKLNRILAHKHSPLKFGGVFHAGVEVNGLEWSYGYSPSESRPGVSCVEPRSHPQHHYRQTVVLRSTEVPAEVIAEIISQLIEEYPGYDYNLLRRNCCHFADEFCRRLGVGGIPGWVHRLARLGAGVDTMLQSAPRLKERIYGC